MANLYYQASSSLFSYEGLNAVRMGGAEHQETIFGLTVPGLGLVFERLKKETTQGPQRMRMRGMGGSRLASWSRTRNG
jgi:hypothetical protein